MDFNLNCVFGQKLLLQLLLWLQKKLLDFRASLICQCIESDTYVHVYFKLGGSLGIPKFGFSSRLLHSSDSVCHFLDRVPEGKGCPVM